MPKYRKKPIVIEAIEFQSRGSYDEMTGEWPEFSGQSSFYPDDQSCQIFTLEGVMAAVKGDMVIRGVNGEFYPCKPDIFAKTYEPVNKDDAAEDETTRG